MIRVASKTADRAGIMSILLAFAREADLEESLDPASFETILDLDQTMVWVADEEGVIVGALCAFQAPFTWNHSLVELQELFWWTAVPGTGVPLLREVLKWADDNVDIVSLSVMDTSPPGVVRVYERAGLTKFQQTFIRGV